MECKVGGEGRKGEGAGGNATRVGSAGGFIVEFFMCGLLQPMRARLRIM